MLSPAPFAGDYPAGSPYVPVVLTNLAVYSSSNPTGTQLPTSGANPPGAQPGGDMVCATYTNTDTKTTDPAIRVGLASYGIMPATPAQQALYGVPATWSSNTTSVPNAAGTLPIPPANATASQLAVYQAYLDAHVLYDSASALIGPGQSATICVNLSHTNPCMPSCGFQWDEIDSFYYANDTTGASSPNAANNAGGLITNFAGSDDYGQFGLTSPLGAPTTAADHIFGGSIIDCTAPDAGSGCGSYSQGCGSCSQGCGSYSQGCGSYSTQCGSYSQGCGSYSQQCNSYSQGCGSYSQQCNTYSQGCGSNSQGCGSYSQGTCSSNYNNDSHCGDD